MAQFRPDIKPPMWGPPDAVQFAVRANAERMGVDPRFYWPMWEQCGNYGIATYPIKDYVAGLHGDLRGNVQFASQGAFFSGGSGDAIYLNQNDYSPHLPHGKNYTLFAHVNAALLLSGENHCLFGGGRINDNDFYLYANGTTGSASNQTRLYCRDEGQVGQEVFVGPSLLGLGDITVILTRREGDQFDLYLDGLKVASGTFTAGNLTPLQLIIGAGINHLTSYTTFRFSYRGLFFSAGALNCDIGDDFAATLHHHPYALLMPVARPVFFDLGGEPPGPGTPYSLTQDMLAGVSSAWVMTQDGMVQIVMPWQFTQDGVMAVSESIATNQDGTASVSTSWLIIQDGDAAVSEITGYYVTMDAVAAISEEVATTQDGSGGVSSTYAIEQDGTGQVSSSYMTVQDAQAQVSEGIIYTVTMDAIAQVSEVITIRQDVVAGIATSYEQLQDIAAGISSGYAIVQDGRAHVIEVDFAQMARVLKVSSGMTAISIKSVGKVRQAFRSTSKLTIIQI